MVESGLVAVRQATVADLGALVPLFDAYRSFYGRPSDPDAAGRFLADRLERRQSVVFVAEESGSALGFTQLYPSFSSVRLARILVLNDLFVAPGARGRGIATLLLGAARDHARRAAAAMLTLSTAIDNVAARSLYERMGWVRQEGFVEYALPLGSD